jgi:prepilin-type N-terminal cleavage/methylation domain-containing protein
MRGRIHHQREASRRPSGPGVTALRRGFTLTEMLVATALTLIILLIFAQIFRSATATVTQQRGIGQNDARARMMSNVLRNDLQKMTFRDHPQSTSRGLVTLGVHDNLDDSSYRPIHLTQAGYFYVSENDPSNDVDDVLQFTIAITQVARNKEDHAYVGKASQIGRPSTASTGAGVFNPEAGIGNPDQNQPEFDDGNNANGASQSRFAEVTYFIRNGTLYRRIMLIRDPLTRPFGLTYDPSPTYYDDMPPMPLVPGQVPLIPGNYNNAADVDPNSTPATGDFWNDFDFAAYHDNVELLFHGKTSLVNTGIGARLSDPKLRFGHQYRLDADALRVQNGWPVEYVDNGNSFIGRLTHEETSDPAFTWPGQFANNPLTQTDLALLNGGVRNPPATAAYSGPRRGEDVLLPNVDAFDVQLWETDVTDVTGFTGRFVNVGHAGTGVLSLNKRGNADYGPRLPLAGVVRNNIFDTWHPDNTMYGPVPYRPLVSDPIAAVDNTVTSVTYNPRLPAARTSWDWEASTAYTIRNGSTPGSRIYPFPDFDFGPDDRPGQAGVDDDGNGVIDDRSELGWAMTDDVAVQNDGIYYEAVDHAQGLTTETSGLAADRPAFRKRYGEKLYDGNIVWECFDNRVGVPLIQITIRYRDPKSNLSRQLTIRHSLTDRAE